MSVSAFRMDSMFLTNRDNQPALFIRQLIPSTPRAGLIFLHGSMVYSQYYLPWAISLAQQGILVWLPDLRGHGMSEGRRGTVVRYEEYLDDLACVAEAFHHRYPGLSTSIGGESYGALVAFLAGALPEVMCDNLILIAPAFQLQFRLNDRLKRIIMTASRYLPGLRPLRPMSVEGVTQYADFSRIIQQDLLVNRRYTLRFLAELLAAQEAAAKIAEQVRHPTCVIVGGLDQVTDNRATVNIMARVAAPVAHYELPQSWHAVTGDQPEESARITWQFMRRHLERSALQEKV